MNDSKFVKLTHQLMCRILLIGIYKRHEDLEQARKLVMVNTISLFAIFILFGRGGDQLQARQYDCRQRVRRIG